MAFHVRDGWWFERLPDGSVLMTHSLRFLKFGKLVEMVRVHFTPYEWASIVSTMSREGETQATWQAALDRQLP